MELERCGFATGNYTRVIVTWGWTDEVAAAAKEAAVELWDFRKVISDIAEACKDPTYFIDETLRTVHVFQWSLVQIQPLSPGFFIWQDDRFSSCCSHINSSE
jgi:hypothetical protein